MTEASSPVAKQGRTEKSNASDSSKRPNSPPKMPFGRAEASWLQGALGETFFFFGDHIDSRFKQVEADVEALKVKVDENTKQIGELKEKLESRTQTPIPLAFRPKPQASAPGMYMETRTHALIGNLGLDTDGKTLEQRAK